MLATLPTITLVPFRPDETGDFDGQDHGARLIDELCASVYRREIQYGAGDERLEAAYARLEFFTPAQKRSEFLAYYGLGECLFAVDKQRGNLPVGFVIVQEVEGRNDCYEIGRYLLEEERHRKYGRSMLAKIEGVLLDRGAKEVIAVTDIQNAPAQRSLLSVGFKPGRPQFTDRLAEFPSARCVTFSKSLAYA